MDVDKLFKLPKVPQSSLSKRKWSEPSATALQTAREEGTGDLVDQTESQALPPRSSKSARVSEGIEAGEEEEEDGSFAPGNDADYFIDEDDDGGRFFGGGLTTQQKRILEIMNSNNEHQEEGEDAAIKAEDQLKTLRKSLVKLERAINKNQEMRVRFGDDPSKFIDSEADLDAALKALVVSTTNPSLFYPEMVKHGTTSSLCNLLSHENVDITASVIELLEELTDDDVLDAGMEGRSEAEQENSQRKGEECMTMLLGSLLDNSLVELLVQNLSRFNDDGSNGSGEASNAMNVESDANAIYHLLGLVENIVSLQSKLAIKFLLNITFLDWLLKRLSRKGSYDQNKGYAGELLGVLMQAGSSQIDDHDECLRHFGKRGGVEKMLEVLATFRKREANDDEEGEFMENIIDVLCSALAVRENKQIFEKEEGTELMCILMKSKGDARLRSVKVLNHAFSGVYGSANCTRFVDNQGLKALFGIFMGKVKHSSYVESSKQDEEHILEIFMSLLNNLKSESVERIRLINKFVEKEYEKVDRLIEIRSNVRTRLRPIEEKIQEQKRNGDSIDEEEKEEMQLSFYLDRIDSGLFSLQLIDYILAWLIMEDDGIFQHIQMIFTRTDTSLDEVIDTLKEYHDNVGNDAIVALSEDYKGQEEEEDTGLTLKDVIVNLVNYLLSLL